VSGERKPTKPIRVWTGVYKALKEISASTGEDMSGVASKLLMWSLTRPEARKMFTLDTQLALAKDAFDLIDEWMTKEPRGGGEDAGR
jgi:hypothetical protein